MSLVFKKIIEMKYIPKRKTGDLTTLTPSPCSDILYYLQTTVYHHSGALQGEVEAAVHKADSQGSWCKENIRAC